MSSIHRFINSCLLHFISSFRHFVNRASLISELQNLHVIRVIRVQINLKSLYLATCRTESLFRCLAGVAGRIDYLYAFPRQGFLHLNSTWTRENQIFSKAISEMLSPSPPYVSALGNIADNFAGHTLAHPSHGGRTISRSSKGSKLRYPRDPRCHFTPSSPRSETGVNRSTTIPPWTSAANLQPSLVYTVFIGTYPYSLEPTPGTVDKLPLTESKRYKALAPHTPPSPRSTKSLPAIKTDLTPSPHTGSPDAVLPDTLSSTFVSTSKNIATSSLAKRSGPWPHD
jgi:hypothetical protein